MGGDQSGRDQRSVGDAPDRARAQQEREHERNRAISPDLTVAHDVERAFAACVRAEAVGGVGKAVLVQRAGEEEHCRDGERRADKGGEAKSLGEPIGDGAEYADAGADHRKGPARADQILARRRRRADRKPRQEG